MAWTGFTDEQLSALKRQVSDEEKPARDGRPQGQHPQRGRGRIGGSRGRGRAGPPPSMRQEPVSQDQMLSKPKQQGPRRKPVTSAEHSVWNELNEPTQRRPPPARRKPAPHQGKDKDGQKEGPKDEGVNPAVVVEDAKKKSPEKTQEEEVEKVKILDEDEGQEREISKLEEFQKKQKQMEEENAKKKNLLARAIADRKKKTQAEAKRLLYIQKELAKIETLLSNDVSILRDKIEEASRDFNDAQRRYQKAEAEYVAAKIHLHKASEMKEALTEHLCTIIHENELRKARKLEELVSKLDVENLEDFDIPEETPPTSPVAKSVPHQTEVTKNPLENNGLAQVSSNNTGVLPTGREDSIVPSGMSSGNLNPTAASEVSTPSKYEEKTEERLPSDEAGETKGTTSEVTGTIISCDESGKKDENPVTENDCDQSSDQPEAEQHVEINAYQT